MNKNNKLFCFSPAVMISTFLIEIGLVFYVIWRFGVNGITRLAVAVLICLAVFQFAEFNVCEGAFGLSSVDWARLGYVSITALPPLGVHLIARLSGDKRRWPFRLAYVLGGVFAFYFLFITGGVSTDACLGNYVIFKQGAGSGLLYGVYYYGLLIAAIGYAIFLAKNAKANIKKSLNWLIIGYLLFMVPTTLVNIIDPSTITGIPSIMCGFAVMLALVIAFAVLPIRFKEVEKKK